MISSRNIEIFPKTIYKVIGITWSPDEFRFDEEHVKSRMDDLCSNNSYYYLFREYRDNDDRSGCHYHGIIFVYDWYKYNRKFKYAFKAYVIKPELIFKFSQEKAYDNPCSGISQSGLDGWINYCIKEWELNDRLCISNNPINISHKYL